MTQKLSLKLAALAFVLLAGVSLVFTASTAYAGTVEFIKKSFTEGFFAGFARQFEVSRSGEVRIGIYGSDQTFFAEGSCNLTQTVVGSHAATTTKEFYCPVTGAASGDTVHVALPRAAGIASGAAGFIPVASYATATDMIGVAIYNGSGSASSSYAQATTSVRYTIYR